MKDYTVELFQYRTLESAIDELSEQAHLAKMHMDGLKSRMPSLWIFQEFLENTILFASESKDAVFAYVDKQGLEIYFRAIERDFYMVEPPLGHDGLSGQIALVYPFDTHWQAALVVYEAQKGE